MSEHSVYAELLNALDEMQQSPAYAVRWPILAEAERTIVSLEKEETRLRQQLALWQGLFGEHDATPRTIEQARVLWDTLQQQLAETTQHLEAQRLATYQAVEREHTVKQQLAEREQELRLWKDAHVKGCPTLYDEDESAEALDDWGQCTCRPLLQQLQAQREELAPLVTWAENIIKDWPAEDVKRDLALITNAQAALADRRTS